jgi:hypothetical protein
MQTVLWVALVMRITMGVLAIESASAPVELARAAAYASAAAWYGLEAGIDPFELVGLARNESDFVEDRVGPDGKDCGLTQTRVTVSRFRCTELRRDYRLAFREAARELSEYRDSCRGAADFDRCRLNRYNSGYRYARSGWHGRYWLRVLCFAEAARAGVMPGDSCRRVRSAGDIQALIARQRSDAEIEERAL